MDTKREANCVVVGVFPPVCFTIEVVRHLKIVALNPPCCPIKWLNTVSSLALARPLPFLLSSDLCD